MKLHRVDFKNVLILLSAFCVGRIGASTEAESTGFQEFLADVFPGLVMLTDKNDTPIDEDLQEQNKVDAENVDFWVMIGLCVICGLSCSTFLTLGFLYMTETKTRATKMEDAKKKFTAKLADQLKQLQSTSEVSMNESESKATEKEKQSPAAPSVSASEAKVSETQMSGTPTASAAASVTGITATTMATNEPEKIEAVKPTLK
ncbi:hypothetical protein L596_006782 [Steinernema carpocapsae]|uniref:Uncharacterized protein n=1 Tax=Steinernema carpocapsae TaxID=34508 RepID=A0A4U5P7Y8_STECR|nr:hypothetical protein L596_006782 [Steinernema carpocapsae]